MKGRIIILLTVLMGITVSMNAAGLDEAAALYEKGDYAGALEIYKNIESEHGQSGQLLFNIGQCYVKAGNLGEGMLSYQRALLLNPGDAETLANIKYIESKVQEANKGEMKGKKLSAVPERPSFFGSIRNWICRNHASNTWALWGAGFFIAFLACVAAYVFPGEVLLRKIGFFGGIGCMALSVIFMIFAFMAANSAASHDKGVIMAYKIELRAEPGVNERKVAMPLTQGTVLDILENSKEENGGEEWYKVRLNSDYVGWIKGGDFEVI